MIAYFIFLSHQDFFQAVGSVFQLAPPSKWCRKHIPYSIHLRITERTANQHQTNLGFILGSSVPALELLNLKEGRPTCGSQAGEVMALCQSYVAKSSRGGGTGHLWVWKGGQQKGRQKGWLQPDLLWAAFCVLSLRCVPSTTSFPRAANGARPLLSAPARAHPPHFSQHPTCFVDLGQKGPGAARPFTTLIAEFFF